MKQELLEKSSDFAEFNAQVSILYSSANDLLDFPSVTGSEEDLKALIENKISEIKMLWQGVKHQSKSVVVQNNFEYLHLRPLGNLEAVHVGGKTNFIRKLNEALARAVSQDTSVHLHDLNYVSSLVGLEEWHDRRFWHLYRYPSSVKSFSFIAESLSAIITGLQGKSKKLLVLDADNTIWGGTLDEAGPEGVKIGRGESEAESFLEFQIFG